MFMHGTDLQIVLISPKQHYRKSVDFKRKMVIVLIIIIIVIVLSSLILKKYLPLLKNSSGTCKSWGKECVALQVT